MRSKEYWARRASERMVDYQADAVKTANEIGRVYFAAQKYLEAEAAKVFRGFRNGFKLSEADARRCLENVPDENALKALRLAVLKMPDGEEKQAALAILSSPAYQYRINRLDALNRNIAKTCGDLCGVELKADKAFLGETAKKAYLETFFDIQKGTGVSGAFDMIPDGTVDQILKRNWSGANYSKRIWGNTRKMADELKSDLLVGVLTGKTEREIADVITARYQTSQFNARRLVQTETTYVVGQAELQAFKEAGAEKYEFSALLDEATSAICRELDGKKFPVSEARPGENYPPMHPFCRSVTVADLPSEEELDKRWGNSADELGLDLPFDEWVKHLQTAPDGKLRYVKDLGGTLDKSVGSGIIEAGSEGMYRKKSPDKIEPMPKKQFRVIKKSFQRQGGIIQQNDETDAYLEKNHAEGITYNAKTILLKQNPGRASVFEELIHTAQYRDGKNDGSAKSRLINEIEAQKKLIKYAKAYKLTEPEIKQTQKALDKYQADLDAYNKLNGGD